MEYVTRFKTLFGLLNTFLQSAEGVHELMHALGFHNEHLREDRNDYVWINRELISKMGLRHEFKKRKTAQRELPYDFGSVMHAPALIKGQSEQ